MYILASDFFEKEKNTYLKLEIRVVCKEFLAIKYVFSFFFETYQILIYICTLEILKICILNRFGFFGTHYSFVFVVAGRE